MMRINHLKLLPVVMVLIGGEVLAASPPLPATASQPTDDVALSVRSVVDSGDTARLRQVLAKARRGEKVTIGVIGGSITQGASATTPEKRYGNLVAAWWREQFPKSQIRFVNAGIGATGSSYGALRVRRDLLEQKPDFIIAEYAVNDPNTRECAETLEGLVRQIIRSPGRPAMLLLFTMHQDGGNAQEWHGKVGRHYKLPMISYRDALWPEIEAGRMKWQDVSADIVHPNDRGHAYAARFITDFLAKTLRSMPAGDPPASALKPPPAPLISDLFEHVSLLEDEALKPVSNQGWTHDLQNHCWKTDQPGSAVEFEVEGTAVLTMHWVFRGPMGRARVTVDGGKPKELEAWFDATWGGYRQTNEIARGLSAGRHRVRIELLEAKNPQSTGHEFRIFGLGTAGTDSRE